jgi:hypothetical protein
MDLAALAETIAPAAQTALKPAPAAVPTPVEEPIRKPIGRPPSPEARIVFGTRLKSDTIAEVEAIKAGLRLKMQGEAIERAVAFYRDHLIAKARAELHLGPETDDAAALAKAFKVDD